MNHDLDKVRAALPMPVLMQRLGMSDYAKKSTKCPWHEDKSPSFGIFQGSDGRYRFKCHAGCGHGDEVDLIQKALNMADKGEAIRYYAGLAGFTEEKLDTPGKFLREALNVFPNASVVKDAAPAPQPKPKLQVELRPLTARQVTALAKHRGYPESFVEAMSSVGMIGTIKLGKGTHWAFPVTDGFHYRAADGSWRYTAGAKPNLFVVGEIEEGSLVHCFESQWDALALASLQDDHDRNNIISTRGNQNARLVAERLKGHTGTVYLWPQNDRQHTTIPQEKWPKHNGKPIPASEKWVLDIVAALDGQQIRIAATPNEHKDFNDWLKAGALPTDALAAMRDAKPPVEESVAASAEPPTSDKTTASDDLQSSNTGSDREAGAHGNADASERGTEETPRPIEATVTESSESELLHSASTQTVAGGESPEPDKSEPGPVQSPTSEAATPALANILDDISTFLKRYVIFPDEDAQATAIALWVAHAWTYKSFKFTPYLNVRSPEKRCGKTRLLECLQIIVPKPQSFVRPTEAVLFRTIEADRPTLLLDEIDTVYSSGTKEGDERSEGIRAVLNAGFQDGPFSVIPRCVGKDNEPKKFETFCPKVIAGIGKNLPDTVRDRSIEILLVRQTKEKQAARFRAESAQREVAPIVAALEKWAAQAGDALANATPKMPEQLSDRQQDMMEPLIAIADMAGGEWPDKGRAAMIALGAITEDASIGVQLLASCRQVFHATNRSKITSNALLGYLIEIEDANAPWATYWEGDYKHGKVHAPARSLAKLLEPFGIAPKTIRLPDDEVAKGYYRNDFLDAWRRYLSPVKSEETMELGL